MLFRLLMCCESCIVNTFCCECFLGEFNHHHHNDFTRDSDIVDKKEEEEIDHAMTITPSSSSGGSTSSSSSSFLFTENMVNQISNEQILDYDETVEVKILNMDGTMDNNSEKNTYNIMMKNRLDDCLSDYGSMDSDVDIEFQFESTATRDKYDEFNLTKEDLIRIENEKLYNEYMKRPSSPKGDVIVRSNSLPKLIEKTDYKLDESVLYLTPVDMMAKLERYEDKIIQDGNIATKKETIDEFN